VILLVGALICYGFFPQTFVRIVAPTFRTYLTTDTSDLTDMQTCSHGAVRRSPVAGLNEDAPQGRIYNEVAWR
jgi:hypothetical protein